VSYLGDNIEGMLMELFAGVRIEFNLEIASRK
jgi:hypothetical protein